MSVINRAAAHMKVPVEVLRGRRRISGHAEHRHAFWWALAATHPALSNRELGLLVERHSTSVRDGISRAAFRMQRDSAYRKRVHALAQAFKRDRMRTGFSVQTGCGGGE